MIHNESLIALSSYFEDGDWNSRKDLVDWIEKNIDPELNEELTLIGERP